MPSPFPGMDPYLETPDLWPDVHHELISEIRSALNPVLRPAYVARVELRVYVSDDDDPGRAAIEKVAGNGAKQPETTSSLAIAEPLIVPVLDEAFLEIRHLETGRLVTIIEVLSPTNKIRGACGRTSFMRRVADVNLPPARSASDGLAWQARRLRSGLVSYFLPLA